MFTLRNNTYLALSGIACGQDEAPSAIVMFFLVHLQDKVLSVKRYPSALNQVFTLKKMNLSTSQN